MPKLLIMKAAQAKYATIGDRANGLEKLLDDSAEEHGLPTVAPPPHLPYPLTASVDTGGVRNRPAKNKGK